MDFRPQFIARRAIAMLALLHAARALAQPAPATAPASTPAIRPGPGSFVFVDAKGDPSKPITVWTWAPPDLSPTTPILFVMHGVQRSGEVYRNNWIVHAQAKHVLLIVPEFSNGAYPGVAYNDGNMIGRDGKPIDPSRWAFAVIEHLFDAVKAGTGNRSSTYFLYGHSAGGQFVERFVLFMPQARYAKAVAANPGWYTLPDPAKPFPAGLKNSTATDATLTTVMGRDITLLLGEKDIDPNDKELPRNAEAMAEGPYRFARGLFFFKALRAAAARLKTPLAWGLRTVPNAAHSDRQMSTAAADLLFPNARR